VVSVSATKLIYLGEFKNLMCSVPIAVLPLDTAFSIHQRLNLIGDLLFRDNRTFGRGVFCKTIKIAKKDKDPTIALDEGRLVSHFSGVSAKTIWLTVC
jgi:hypothetical protein